MTSAARFLKQGIVLLAAAGLLAGGVAEAGASISGANHLHAAPSAAAPQMLIGDGGGG
jgi:hypothetical protein